MANVYIHVCTPIQFLEIREQRSECIVISVSWMQKWYQNRGSWLSISFETIVKQTSSLRCFFSSPILPSCPHLQCDWFVISNQSYAGLWGSTQDSHLCSYSMSEGTGMADDWERAEEEAAWWVKCLSYKCGDLNSNPQHSHTILWVVVWTHNPSTWRQRQEDPRASLDNELQV